MFRRTRCYIISPAIFIPSAIPVLSNAVDTALGPTSATITVDTTIGNGTCYWVVLLTADSTPTQAEIKLGQKSGGAAAEDNGSKTVVSTGTQTFTTKPTLLNPETGYKVAYMHESATGVQSSVLVADGFSTTAVVIGSAEGGGASTTDPMAITTSFVVVAGDAVVAMSSEQGAAPTVTAVTDNLGNTYTIVDADGHTISTTSMTQWQSIITVPGTITSISFDTTASANDIGLKAAAYNGPFSGLDAAPAIRGDASSNFTSNASGTLAQASELAVTCIATTNVAGTLTANSPWTMAGSQAAGGVRTAAIAHQGVEATTSVTGSFAGTDTNSAVGVMTFARSV